MLVNSLLKCGKEPPLNLKIAGADLGGGPGAPLPKNVDFFLLICKQNVKKKGKKGEKLIERNFY